MIKHLVQPPRRWLCKALLVCCGVAVMQWPNSAFAKEYTFDINPSLSSVDLTAFGVIAQIAPPPTPTVFTLTSTSDTQTMALGGVITLDVDIVNDAVQSVDFVSLQLDYQVDLANPTTFTVTTLVNNPIDDIPAGDEREVRLPFDVTVAQGNPVTVFAPTLTLESADAGTETGAGGDLNLTGSEYGFVGTGQYFGLPEPTNPESNFRDGFPIDLGPYPQNIPDFPSVIPITETTTTPAPTGPEFLDGSVTVDGNALVFSADFLSYGIGGAGIAKSALIHDGSFVATVSLVEFVLGDMNGDGVLDNLDIAPFVSALIDPAGYTTAFPALDPDVLGDFDSDGTLTNLDIFGFVDALQTPAALSLINPVPEPAAVAVLLFLLATTHRCSRKHPE